MEPLKLAIVGQDTLAATARTCCADHFSLVDPSDHPDILWICYDTPLVDSVPQSDTVMAWTREIVTPTCRDALVLVSSQMPVGTIRELETLFPGRSFAYSPENIRVKTAVEDFQQQARIIVGVRRHAHHALLRTLFAPFTERIIFTDPETAEMCKHALNAFLGLQIAFINEIAAVAKVVLADPEIIAQALLTERRVSPHAPLHPGSPFGGGHLARDIFTLTEIAKVCAVPVPIIAHIQESNHGVR